MDSFASLSQSGSTTLSVIVVVIVVLLILILAAQLGWLPKSWGGSEHLSPYYGASLAEHGIQALSGGADERHAQEFTSTNQGQNPMNLATYHQYEQGADYLGRGMREGMTSNINEQPPGWPGITLGDYSLYAPGDPSNRTFMGYVGKGPMVGTDFTTGEMSTFEEQNLYNVMQGGKPMY